MSDEKVHTYEGDAAEVDWDGRLCIHVGECGRAANTLFVGGRKPWCRPDEVEADVTVDVVTRCPTGALSLRRKDGGPGGVPPGRPAAPQPRVPPAEGKRRARPRGRAPGHRARARGGRGGAGGERARAGRWRCAD